jgi:hypothetical protein
MKYLLLAAVFAFAAACASADPAAQSDAGASAGQSAQGQTPNYEDARSTASDAEVRDARRAYRAACQTRHNDAYCECMTGGMAQALPPSDLAVATAAFTGQNVSASQETRARLDATRAEVERGCTQFR